MRTFPSPLIAALDAGRVAYAGMIRLDLGEGSFGLIQSAAPFTHGGVEYKPVPRGLISVSGSQLSTGTTATGFQLQLAEAPDNGVTPTVIMDFEAYDYMDRPVTVFDLHVNPDTGASLGDPVPLLRGYISVVRHESGPGGHVMTLECEDRGMDYSRTNGRQNSDQDQRRILATDTWFSSASWAGKRDLKWGRK